MKFFGILFIAAAISVVPVIVIGAKYSDGIFTDNTYNKSLDYDAARKINRETQIVWTEPECSEDLCKISVTMDPAPEAFRLRVFRPASKDELVMHIDKVLNTWIVEYINNGDGWYIYKLDYMRDGVLVNAEKSYLLQKEQV